MLNQPADSMQAHCPLFHAPEVELPCLSHAVSNYNACLTLAEAAEAPAPEEAKPPTPPPPPPKGNPLLAAE